MIDQILVIDDEKEVLEVIKNHLSTHGYLITTALSGEAGLEALKEKDFSLVITDLKMPGLNGIELCDRISGNYPDLPVLILTAFGTLDVAVEAIRAGAYDFMVKPLNFEALSKTVEKEITNYKARRQVKQLEKPEKRKGDPLAEEVLGEGRFIADLRGTLNQIVDLDTTVLITGESGTGKELVSRVMHKYSKRRQNPFVVVDCASIPEVSFERELFGSADPVTGKIISHGLVAAAQNGTLFLDEIVHLPLAIQPKLLRLLEERLYKPVGSTEEMRCAARFVVATNADLESAIKKGEFREDLFFRINVMHLHLIPLRDRGNDILILAHHFLRFYSERMKKPVKSLSEPAAERLIAYSWPGNVRELRNTIERAMGMTSYDHIVVEDLPEQLQRFKITEVFKPSDAELLLPVDVVEQRHILGVLKELGGNKALASKVLKMDRKTLYRKLKTYGYEG